MPPGGVHLACGVALARWALPAAPRVVPARHGAALRTAVVFGSIVPVRTLRLFLSRRCARALRVVWRTNTPRRAPRPRDTRTLRTARVGARRRRSRAQRANVVLPPLSAYLTLRRLARRRRRRRPPCRRAAPRRTLTWC
jgi:hypothetical protein